MRWVLQLFFLFLTVSFVTPFWPFTSSQDLEPEPKTEYGECSWYGDTSSGRPPFRMANGQLFNSARLSAAHRTLPLGSFVTITNTDNSKTVAVEITDRGPSVFGRISALSPAAFAAVADLDQKVFPCIITLGPIA